MSDFTTILVRIDDEGKRTNVCVVPTFQEAINLAEQLNELAKVMPEIWHKAFDLYLSQLDTGDRALRPAHKEAFDETVKVWHDKVKALVGDLMDPDVLQNRYDPMTFGVEQIRTLGK